MYLLFVVLVLDFFKTDILTVKPGILAAKSLFWTLLTVIFHVLFFWFDTAAIVSTYNFEICAFSQVV